MSFGLGLGLTLGGTSGGSKFPASGPSLDLVFAGAATSGSAAANSSLDLNFTGESYTVGDPYSVWTGSRMQTRGFQDVVTFSRSSANATYYNSSGYLTTAGVWNYLTQSSIFDTTWTKSGSFIQTNLLTYSNQSDNAVWTKSNAFVQSNLLTYSGQFDNAAWVKINSFVQTNLLLWSEDFTNAAWIVPFGTIGPVVANSTVSPDGTLTADTVSATSVNATFWQTYSPTAGTIYTGSIWLKRKTGTGTIGVTADGSTFNTVDLSSGGWVRGTQSYTAAIGTKAVGIRISTSGDEVYVWGAQLVLGSVPGDYVATTSAAAAVTYPNWDGRRTARKLCENNAVTIAHFLDSAGATITAGVHTGSVRLKAGERTSATMYLVDSVGIVSGTVSTFNLTTGVVTTGTQASIVSVGGGYFQCAIYGTCAAGAGAKVRILLSDGSAYTGDGSSGIYISDSQLVQGSVPGDYRATTSAALPCLYADYNDALRARKLCENNALQAHRIQQTVSLSGTPVTLSQKLKAGERTWAYLRIDDAVSTKFAYFNLSAGTVGSATAPLTSTITNVGDGWYVCTATFAAPSATASGVWVVGVATGDGVNTYTGDGSSGIYIADAQIVQGSVPGDYRETTTAALSVLYADYNGALRARKLCENTANALHYMTPGALATSPLTADQVYSYTVKVKAGERTRLYMDGRRKNNTFFNLSVDLSTGVITPGTNLLTYNSVNLGNGWWQVNFTTNVQSGAFSESWAIAPDTGAGGAGYTGDGSSGIYVSDAQVAPTDIGTLYFDTAQYPYNAPRFDYDPVTLAAKGLLVEELRANLLLQSNDFLTSWTQVNITRTLNQTLSPDGNVNGVKIAATASAATTEVQGATVAATSATGSVYVKQGTGATTANSFGIRNQTTLTDLVVGTLNYSTGVFTYITGSTGVVVTNAGNGWWRIAISATAGITSGDTVRLYVGFIGGAATAGDFLYAYGAQLEAGAFATSYIPTTTSQLTRAADLAIAYTLSPWFNAQAGTAYVQFDSFSPVTSVYSEALGIATYPGTQDGFVSMGIDNAADATTFGGTYLGSATFQSSFSNANGTWYTPNKIANSYKLNDFAFSSNGAAAQVDTSGTVPPLSSTHAMMIGVFGTSRYLNGHIQRVTYYPRRLTDTELQTLTT